MQIYKKLLGQNELQDKVIKYYVIQNNRYYGIELEEQQQDEICCESEFFTETFQEALALGEAMRNGMVSLISMVEIIDDYVQ